jgi:glycosyltransferase involved in cell wall biosynthesis
MQKFRFHLLGLAHVPQSKTYLSCAFTQKNRKLAKMLTDLGHEVFFYGSEGSDVAEYCKSPNLHFVQTHTLKDIAQSYGDGDNRFEIGYDWTNQDFRHDFDKPLTISTLKFNEKCIEYINKNKKQDDFLLCTQGNYHTIIANAVNLFLTVEPGIGYRGSVEGRYRAFESSYIQNFTYGSEHPHASINGSYYDRVIPNYFDPADIVFSDRKDDYYLFIGRIIKRKGILTAIRACNAIDAKLLIVGQGGRVNEHGQLHDENPTEFYGEPGTWQYLGFADIEKRKELMAHAKAVFAPTEYLECFAGTHIEAMLSGTPILTTNFGVFPGTVINGVNGYRCDTSDDFAYYAKEVTKLNPDKIRESAQKYLMENVQWQFQKWFEDLYAVWESALDEIMQLPAPVRRKAWNRIWTEGRDWHKHLNW